MKWNEGNEKNLEKERLKSRTKRKKAQGGKKGRIPLNDS
jgi:hypothetical protein